jgi:5-methyltetrahydropteroyltriglutamate--homocysteine methyltransferase
MLVTHIRASKVADRILRYAAIAGRENVVAGMDCGLGGRVHADLMQGGVLSEN